MASYLLHGPFSLLFPFLLLFLYFFEAVSVASYFCVFLFLPSFSFSFLLVLSFVEVASVASYFLFLASPDALEVIVVTDSLTHLLTHGKPT